jgi:hypothetical protein
VMCTRDKLLLRRCRDNIVHRQAMASTCQNAQVLPDEIWRPPRSHGCAGRHQVAVTDGIFHIVIESNAGKQPRCELPLLLTRVATRHAHLPSVLIALVVEAARKP